MLDNAEAALRTACLTGVADGQDDQRRSPHPTATPSQLTAGDVDEAVSGILTNGLAASDVNGESVPSGFSRIDAFRVGVLGDEDRCFKRFRELTPEACAFFVRRTRRRPRRTRPVERVRIRRTERMTGPHSRRS